jgi:hypothetical protein
MSAGEEVLQASEQFYAALGRFLNGDSKPMTEIWSHGPDVTAMHSAPTGWLGGGPDSVGVVCQLDLGWAGNRARSAGPCRQ